MATVAELWGEPEVKPKGGASDITPKQKSFSTYKDGIVINEQAAPQQPQGSTIADLWESTPAATPAELKKQSGSIVGEAIKKGFEMRQQLQGAGEVGLTTLTGAVAAPLAAVTGVIAAARSGKFGTKEGVKAGEEQAANLMGQMTYQPRTEKGQEYIQGLQKAFEASKLPPVGVPELAGFAPLAGPATQQVAGAVKKGVFAADQALVNEATMLGGAVKDATKPMQEAFQKVKDKLPSVRMEKAPVETMKGMGAAEVDAARLRQERGNQLLVPMGDDMTKSMITRNPADVMFERETAKSPEFGGPLQEKYAYLNDKLQRNLQSEVDQTGAQMVGMDAPDFGQFLSEKVGKYKSDRYQDVSDTYKKAQDAGETAQLVPYKGITDLIQKETQGRPTKKEQNPLYAIVEEELKANDPQGTGMISVNAMEDIRKLINEEADPSKKGSVRLGKQIKGEIDKATENAGGDFYKEARAKNRAFEAEFEDQGIIRDINRLKRGTSDRVVPLENLADKLVFKGTGADVKAVFATLEKMGPEGQQIANELRGYAADKIKEQATKGVGRDINGKPYVSTAELDKQINALDKSGKLDFLFGKQQAERYRTLNEFTKDIQTTPQGTVNTSGTTSTLLSALGEMGASAAVTGIPAPIATITKYGYDKYKTKQKMQKVQEYANPGTKISDIPRIEMRGMATKD